MALYRVVTGQYINAQDIDQLVEVLQHSSGGQEIGKYFLTNNSYVSGSAIGEYISSLSRGAVPISVTIDTIDQAQSNCSSPTTDHLSSNGFRVSATSNAVATSVIVGGNYTISY